MLPFEKQKVEAHIFNRGTLSGFTATELATNDELNTRKQVLLFNLRLWLSQIRLYKFGLYCMGKNVHMRNIYCVKAMGFGFKISSFPRTLFLSMSYSIYCGRYVASKM